LQQHKATTSNCARVSSCSITSSFIYERQPVQRRRSAAATTGLSAQLSNFILSSSAMQLSHFILGFSSGAEVTTQLRLQLLQLGRGNAALDLASSALATSALSSKPACQHQH
jgi:hypothetical protein